ncbi:MAG: molecular chaperone DnaJ [Anaerolineales bacterium]|nr:molecular chaperone DnaJ [Anaerolineales bacterium]
MTKRDYYEVLGISRISTKEEINAAFRRLARQYHPDVSTEPDAEEKFKELNEAKDVLLDEQKRAAYDRFGHDGVNRMGGIPNYDSMDLSDIFEELFGFGFGGRRSTNYRKNMPKKGYDLQYSVQLSFEEAYFGLEKEIEITRDESCSACEGSGAKPGTSRKTCATCNGQGQVRQSRQTLFGSMVQVVTCPTCQGEGSIVETPCAKCNGRGTERFTRKKNIKIPGGMDNGTQIRLSGEGQPGTNGGPSGDVFLAIRVKNHKFFQRQGNDVVLNIDINIAQATLGSDVKIPTIEGEDIIQIPAGTQTGKTIRLKGKGFPALRGDGRGDQINILNITTPKHLTPEQRELFEKLAESLGTEVHPQEKGLLDILKDVFNG